MQAAFCAGGCRPSAPTPRSARRCSRRSNAATSRAGHPASIAGASFAPTPARSASTPTRPRASSSSNFPIRWNRRPLSTRRPRSRPSMPPAPAAGAPAKPKVIPAAVVRVKVAGHGTPVRARPPPDRHAPSGDRRGLRRRRRAGRRAERLHRVREILAAAGCGDARALPGRHPGTRQYPRRLPAGDQSGRSTRTVQSAIR